MTGLIKGRYLAMFCLAAAIATNGLPSRHFSSGQAKSTNSSNPSDTIETNYIVNVDGTNILSRLQRDLAGLYCQLPDGRKLYNPHLSTREQSQ